MKRVNARPDKNNTTAVIVAGGKGTRMGGQDKGLIKLDGKPIIEHIIGNISPQLNHIIINANRNLQEYRQLGYPVIEDNIPGFQGPLAGILSALNFCSTDFILTLPCDSYNLAEEYFYKMTLAYAENNAEIAVASDGNRMQQMYALIPVSLTSDLSYFLDQGNRAVKDWYAQHKITLVDFSSSPEMFINLNFRKDLTQLD